MWDRLVKLGPFKVGFGLALCIAFLDQLSKWWILDVVMQPPRLVPVMPFFNLVLGWNRGVSFGMFDTGSPIGRWILVGITAAITIGMLVWLWRVTRFREAIAIAFIIGGSVGNITDRIRFGAVTDFLDVYIGTHHWPAFNVADSAIMIGAAIIVLDSLFTKGNQG